MAGTLAAQRGPHALALMVMVVVYCWKECITQEHLAFQSSCMPENISQATNSCIEQGWHIFSLNDYNVPGTTEAAQAHNGSIWVAGNSDGCQILKNVSFISANCSEQHYYLCKRKATIEEELSRNDTRTWAIYVPCKNEETPMSPPSSIPGTPETRGTSTTTSKKDSASTGLSDTAIYLIVAVAVCFVVVCVVAAVVIKRCTAKKQENVTLQKVDVVREKNGGVAMTENGGNNDDTPM